MSTIPCPKCDELMASEELMRAHAWIQHGLYPPNPTATMTPPTPPPSPTTPPPPLNPPEEGGEVVEKFECDCGRGNIGTDGMEVHAAHCNVFRHPSTISTTQRHQSPLKATPSPQRSEEAVNLTNGETAIRLPCFGCKQIHLWMPHMAEDVRAGKMLCYVCREGLEQQAKGSVLTEALKLISQDRRAEYGAVEDSFKHVAKMWSVLLQHEVKAKQVALCMAALKMCREIHAAKRDSLVDACGYLALAQQIEEAKQ